MKNWLNNWKNRRHSLDLEHVLRAERPTPPEHLVKSISAHVNRRRPNRAGFAFPALRLGRAAVVVAVVGVLLVGSSLAAGLGPAGGINLSSVIHYAVHPSSPTGPPGSAASEYVGAPTVTGFSPTSGLVGSTVAISGTNFGATSSVTFNGTSAAYSVNSATSITATVPAGATNGPIRVTNQGGHATSATSFIVIQTPSVGSFSPTFGPVGTTVTISGSHFTGSTAVKFNTTSAPSFSVDSDTQITASVPTGATTGKITVTNPAGSGQSSSVFTVATESAPTVSSFAPTSGKVGTSVTINGTNFTGSTEVDFNGTPATFTVNSATKITAKVPTGATTGKVNVINGAGNGLSTGDFSVIVAPAITSFTPAAGGVGKLVTINGSGFTGTTAVKFGTKTATFTFVSDTQLTATVPTGAVTAPISVTNPVSTATSSTSFIVSTASPTVTGFTPAFGAAGASVTITGTNLANTTSVSFGTTPASFVVNSATSITAAVPTIAPVSGGTNVAVSVTTDIGTGASASKFSVIEPPSITSFSPASGLANATVTISGSGFLGTGKTGGDFVKFNGITATFTVTNDTTISAKVPGGATTGTISVKNAAGTSTSGASFVVPTGAPTIATFSPSTGLAGHTAVVITGTHLDGATKVMFGSKQATNITGDTATEIDAVVPAGATTGPVSVTTAGGTATTGTTKFTVDATPKVTGFNVSSGKAGDPVTILGSGFAPVETGGAGTLSDDHVTFTGHAPVAATATDDGHITVTIPAGATTGKVTVSNHYGDAGTSTAVFTVLQTPAITTFSPGSGLAGTTMVTINGSGFTGATSVAFNGTVATFTVNSDSKITAKVPVGASTGTITVTNPVNTATSASSFVVSTGAPTISTFSPSTGLAGHTAVAITGTHLDGATKVSFGGKAATNVTSDTATEIDVVVPAGATTGPVSVMTPAGTVTTGSTKFTVDATPKVTGFSVSSGKAGDSVTILGSGFAPVETGGAGTLTDDHVTFAGHAPVAATATNDGSITLTIPAGATTGKVTVSNHYGDAGTSTAVFTVFQAPAISTFSPGSALVGASVTINGSGFTGATVVKFNTTAATTFTVNSDTKITAKVPVGATTGFIQVTNPVSTATSAAAFVVPTGSPTVTSLNPTNGPSSSQAQSTVTIIGASLRGASKVTFNGKASTSVSVVDDNTIVAVTPAGATTGKVQVTTPAGMNPIASAPVFTVNAPPKITGLSATSGVAGTTSITITGTGFLAKEGTNTDNHVTVTFGTGSTATTAASDTSIVVTVPNNGTTGKITVANNFGETGTSTAVFTVIHAPNITSFTPGSGTPGSSVTLNGTGFTGTSSVQFGATAATFTVNNDGKITAKVPMTLAAGSYTLSVTNAAGAADTHLLATPTFTVVTAPPTISGFTPSDGPSSSALTSDVKIAGANLAGATSVMFNGKAATNVSYDTLSGQCAPLAAPCIEAHSPVGATSGPIKVTTPKGVATSATNFVVDPPPSISSFTPSAGPGQTVTITGSGFFTKFNGAALDNDTSVAFNGLDAGDTACNGGPCITGIPDDNHITVLVPDAAASGPITVTNGHGETGTSAGIFSVVPLPSITSFAPTSGAVGDPIVLTGSHFSGATAVAFNGTTATSFHVDSDTQITVTVPVGATDGAITVTRPSGTGTSSTNFNVTP